jgi:hypothetical protein
MALRANDDTIVVRMVKEMVEDDGSGTMALGRLSTSYIPPTAPS